MVDSSGRLDEKTPKIFISVKTCPMRTLEKLWTIDMISRQRMFFVFMDHPIVRLRLSYSERRYKRKITKCISTRTLRLKKW